MIARIAPIPRSSKAILRSFLQGHKGGDWLISGIAFHPLAAVDPPDGLVLDVTGCTDLFGGEASRPDLG
jgi:hypothetical protein